MLFVHDGALQNWKDAAKALFTHRNPLTGRTYAEEPGLAFVCLVNENSIQQAIKDSAKNPYLQEAWKRTCALYATAGDFTAGALSVKNEGGEATVWVTSLDGRPVGSSGRLLVVRLGDVQSVGTQFADASCRKVLKWGRGFCMEAGRSEISIRRERPCAVWSLDMAGRRRRQVAVAFTEGTLRFDAEVAADPEEASFAYELIGVNEGETKLAGDE